MTQRQYERLSAPFRAPVRRKLLIWINRLATMSVYAAYCLMCLYLLVQRDIQLISLVTVCGVPFLLLSAYRARKNAPRPYEVWDITPLIPKNTRGKSFPSRHVFSAFVIATAIFPIQPLLGATLSLLGVALMALRVLGGVHFPKDVIVGALAGIVSGTIGNALWNILGGMI